MLIEYRTFHVAFNLRRSVEINHDCIAASLMKLRCFDLVRVGSVSKLRC